MELTAENFTKLKFWMDDTEGLKTCIEYRTEHSRCHNHYTAMVSGVLESDGLKNFGAVDAMMIVEEKDSWRVTFRNQNNEWSEAYLLAGAEMEKMLEQHQIELPNRT